MTQNTLSLRQPTIVQPQGHLNASNAMEFQFQLTLSITSDRNSEVLVDLSQVESLDSAGLMALVSAFNQSQRLNCRFSLCSIPPAVKIVLELTQLDQVLEIFENRAAFEAAIA